MEQKTLPNRIDHNRQQAFLVSCWCFPLPDGDGIMIMESSFYKWAKSRIFWYFLLCVTDISKADYKSKYPGLFKDCKYPCTPAGSAPNRNGLLGSHPHENSKEEFFSITQNIPRFSIWIVWTLLNQQIFYFVFLSQSPQKENKILVCTGVSLFPKQFRKLCWSKLNGKLPPKKRKKSDLPI